MKLYIETSVPNMLLHDDAPDKSQITKLFIEWLRLSAHEPFISPVVNQEIARTQGSRRELLEQVVLGMRPTLLEVTPEVEILAEQYLARRIIPIRFRDDLLHVAVAVCYRLDIIVSWNMKHLANPNKVALINAVNRSEGRSFVRIHTPKEMMGL
jgi:predicted nucleic acid-binding protein